MQCCRMLSIGGSLYLTLEYSLATAALLKGSEGCFTIYKAAMGTLIFNAENTCDQQQLCLVRHRSEKHGPKWAF